MLGRPALGDDLQRGEPGRGRQRIGVEGPLLQNAFEAVLVQLTFEGLDLQDVALADDRATRQAAGHDLGQGSDVGRDAIDLLGAARAVAEAGDHLVEDQHHAALGGERAQVTQKRHAGGDDAVGSAAGLDDDRRHLARVRIEQLADRVDVVRVGHQHRLGDRFRDARRRWRIERRLIAGHGVVVPAVEVAREADDLYAPRIRPSIAHG